MTPQITMGHRWSTDVFIMVFDSGLIWGKLQRLRIHQKNRHGSRDVQIDRHFYVHTLARTSGQGLGHRVSCHLPDKSGPFQPEPLEQQLFNAFSEHDIAV